MKKLMIVAVMALAAFTGSAQEGLKVGGFISLPVGDAGDVSSFGIGLDAKYMFAVSDEFTAGPAIGYTNSFSKEVKVLGIELDVPNVQFLPIAAAAQYKLADKFSVGLDLGYAIGVNEGNDGGFYYRPGMGYAVSDAMELGLSYSGVSMDSITWSNINLGVLFSL